MKQRDADLIARRLNGVARSCIFGTQTKATTWFIAIEAVADALQELSPTFDRAAFLQRCRRSDEEQRLAREACAADAFRTPEGGIAYRGRTGPLAEPINDGLTD